MYSIIRVRKIVHIFRKYRWKIWIIRWKIFYCCPNYLLFLHQPKGSPERSYCIFCILDKRIYQFQSNSQISLLELWFAWDWKSKTTLSMCYSIIPFLYDFLQGGKSQSQCLHSKVELKGESKRNTMSISCVLFLLWFLLW